MGVVVYGYRPKIWFLLNRHERFDTLLQEIQSTPFDESPGNNIGEFFIYPASLSYCILFEITELHLRSCPAYVLLCIRRHDICMSPSAGEAMAFTRQYLLTPVAGRRPRVPGAVVIIADKKSADNLTLAASNLRATGVSSVKLLLIWLDVTACTY